MSPSATNASVTPFAFQPPVGGDVALKSCEGTIFNAHSVLLGLASTVFAGMFTGASIADTIELAEDAETISLMLAFIYPVTPPPITTVDQLEKVMHFSQKYDIAKMIDYVEKGARPESELVHSDPIRLFRASMKYGFPTIKSHCIRAFRPKHCDVFSVPGLLELAQHFPEAAPVIGLIGTQVVRSKIMPKIRADIKPPRRNQAHAPDSDNHLSYMVCRKCWDRCSSRISDRYFPGWLHKWRRLVQSKLTEEPIHKCEGLFKVTCFTDYLRWTSGEGLDLGCSDCIAQTLTKRSMFEEWAQDVKKSIEREFKALDVLYTL